MYIKKMSAASQAVWAIVGIMVLLIVLFAVFKKKEKQEPESGEKSLAVRTLTLEAREFADRIKLPGRLYPFVEANLSAEKGGIVVDMPVEKGQRVGVNDLLLRVDTRMWTNGVQQARIQNEQAEKDFARREELRKTGGISESDFEEITRRRDLSRLALAQARLHLEQCDVRSPISGLVEDRYVELGENIKDGVPVVRVADIAQLKLKVDIPEKHVFSVVPGKKMTFRVSGAENRSFEGEVTFVSASADRAGNSFQTELLFDNGDGLLKGGMMAELELVTSVSSGVVVVPLSAIIADKGDHVAFVVEAGRAVRRIVKIKDLAGQEVVIHSGLKPGDELIVEGHRTLRDGGQVTVVNEGQAES